MKMKTVLVTGGSRGIGLEFCRQYLKKGNQVVAASRNPEKSHELKQLRYLYNDHLVILKIDVGDEESRRSFYQALSAKTGRLDVLINSAGIISGNEQFCYPFGWLKQEDLCRTLLINSIAPLMMVEMVLPMLKKGSKPLVVNITSDNGSIARKSSKGKYGYSASKAALNMITKILSIELREHEIIAISLHPGWVKTTMTQNENAPLEPVESINGMLRVIESLEMKDSGRFLDWRGDEIPW
jgi:NAD(P)-dependent dehydrogenase (short-subunit alcohol dehydrogenase family)